MRHFASIFLLLVSLVSIAFGQNRRTLSDETQISVITLGPDYKELYAAFGHNAIRVLDPQNGIDFAYNYGTFDFNQPHFYLNFARGNLLYMLSVQDYQRLKEYYIYYNRFIHEQVLDLTQAQKQLVFDYLQNNARPENATYNYDYFYDNCATRIRDVFIETLGYDLRFDNSHIQSRRSIRELTDDYLIGHFPWGDLGIDLCLGLPMDKTLSPMEYMFLPDYIEAAFDHAWIKTAGGEKPLVSRKDIVFTPDHIVESKTKITPFIVFLVVFLIVIALTRSHQQKKIRGTYLDLSIFITVGFLGIFLTLLWFATDHKAAAGNLNLIWAFPVHFFAAFALIKKNPSTFWKKYFKVTAIAMALLLVFWILLPQMLHMSLTFICAAIMVRAAYIGWGKAYFK